MVPLCPPVVSFTDLLVAVLLLEEPTESLVQETIEITATITVAKSIFFILSKIKSWT